MTIGGTPVGNMIIKVDLDSAGVEKSMTGLQRQLRSSNKMMGAQLSAFDRGDRSARKYGVVIEGLSNRQRIQAQMVAEARTRYNQMTDAYGENSVKAQQAGQALNEQIARYQETSRELENITAEYKEFQRVQEIQSTGWYKTADAMDHWGGKMIGAGQWMDDTGKTMTRRITLPLGLMGGAAIKVGSDFEAGMSRVGAVSGASADEMEKLEVKAREMGATTVFSATEASDAMYYMSLAGWDAQESMDGISGVMDLAAASGEDLAQVADIVTDGLTAFNMTAEESGRMADVLAAASANANTDVTGLGHAFQYVAPVAGALGYSIEDTSKAIGLMSNAGVKGQKAGTALRKIMNSLAKPTAAAQKEMEKYGISLTDSEDNMKSFDDVMLDLRKGLGGLSEDQQAQAAATIFGQEAMSGALAVVNASESDYKKLSDAIADSDGAASEMAETMQDNLQGSLKELKSMLEDLFIEMYQNLKPALESLIDSAKDLTQWFADLSPKTQENIVKFGALAFAAGPVLSIFGKLTKGVGGLVQGSGKLVKSIGLANGAGLAGVLGGLGPAGVAGVAVAGITGISYAVYKLMDDSEELQEINTETAESFMDQALELEKSADTFDKLSDKAKVSNEELAELHSLNNQIAKETNPGIIDELQKRYDDLAKKSGLSKDELQKLFEANDTILKQSPDVEKAIDDQGNAFAKNTDAVREYIDTLKEASFTELQIEREKAIENEIKLQDELTKKMKEKEDIEKEFGQLKELHKMSEEDLQKLYDENLKILKDEHATAEEKVGLDREAYFAREILNGKYTEQLKLLQDSLAEKEESIRATDEEIQKNKELDATYGDLLLHSVGINEEGQKGLALLDETIEKNEKELNKLQDKLDKNGKLNEEEQKRYDSLTATVEEQREARDVLHDELGLYKDINSLVNNKLDGLDEEKQKKIENLAKDIEIKNTEKDIVAEIEKKNNGHKKEREELVKNLEKQGATKEEIKKQTKELDDKIGKNAEVKKQILEELGLWDVLEDSIKDGINSEINRGKAIDESNKKTDSGIKKEQERTKEASKDVTKNVDARDNGTVNRINKLASEMKTKAIKFKADGRSLANVNSKASRAVTKSINFVAGAGSALLNAGRAARYAHGTPTGGHPGGHAVLGDGVGSNAGREFVSLPSGKAFLSASKPTLYPDLPKGTQVLSAKHTRKYLSNIPRYQDGVGSIGDLLTTQRLRNSEFMKHLALYSRRKKQTRKNDFSLTNVTKKENKQLGQIVDKLTEQVTDTKQLVELVAKILMKNSDVVIDGRIAGQLLEPYITENQNRSKRIRDEFKGR